MDYNGSIYFKTKKRKGGCLFLLLGLIMLSLTLLPIIGCLLGFKFNVSDFPHPFFDLILLIIVYIVFILITVFCFYHAFSRVLLVVCQKYIIYNKKFLWSDVERILYNNKNRIITIKIRDQILKINIPLLNQEQYENALKTIVYLVNLYKIPIMESK